MTRVRKQPIIALYFESEKQLKFYNLEARFFTHCILGIFACKVVVCWNNVSGTLSVCFCVI